MRVEILSSKWNRGRGPGRGLFFDGHSYCALGFVLKALGFTDTALLGRGSIAELVRNAVPVPDTFIKTYDDGFQIGSDFSTQVTACNDDDHLTDNERMARLSLFMEPHGYHLEFHDDRAQ